MRHRRICLLGGTGFVGRHLTTALAKRACFVRVLTRRRERHRHLLVLPNVQLLEVDVYDTGALTRSLAGCDAAVNLVGILNEPGSDGQGFRRVHVELTEKVIKSCREAGVGRLLHMSALNADAERGPSHYLRTKGEAERRVHGAASERLRVTSFQPSVIFGPDDSFFNRFARLLRFTPWVFPLASPDSRFAPVYVGDVVAAFLRALDDRATHDGRYPLCGPRSYSLKELVCYTARTLGLRRIVIGLGPRLSRLQAGLLERIPGKPMSRDNLASLSIDSVCEGDGLGALGIEPTPLEAIVPLYLTPGRLQGRYDRWRASARRG